MYNVPSFGCAQQTSDPTLLLNDLLNGMGNYFTKEEGSLNWIECYVYARALARSKQFINLMANQLSPATVSILLPDWSQIYNISSLADPGTTKRFIEFKQTLFSTPPILSNITTYFQNQLGPLFIDLEWRPELQKYATTDPTVQVSEDGYAYSSPLSAVMVYVWQPRTNQDVLTYPTNLFNQTVDSYHAIIEDWNPAYIGFITINLTNRGFGDGYCDNHFGSAFFTNPLINYVDGYNVVSGTAGSAVLTGVGTTFNSFPVGSTSNFQGDFEGAVAEGFNPPVQIVDDLGALQTYFVLSVQSNTQLTLTTPLINNVTSRTYRTLGILLDTPGMLDDAMLFNV